MNLRLLSPTVTWSLSASTASATGVSLTRGGGGGGAFALHVRGGGAGVGQGGQRVAGGELVDLLVVVRLHAGVADELEDAFADCDVVAVGQHGLGDRGVVDAGGVGRAEIEDAVLVAVAPDLAMLARDALVGDAQVRLLRPPEIGRAHV